MQPSHSLDPSYTAPHAPYSPSLSGPPSGGSNGSVFNPPAMPNGIDGSASGMGMQRTGSAMGATGRADKGKQVVREADHLTEEEEATRQRNVERVLKRAEAAKLARTFRNRLALAGFKAQRGWQDLKLDVIEPHMEQEALRRQGGGGPSPNLASPHLHPQLQPQHFAPAPSPYPPQPQYHDSQVYAQSDVYGMPVQNLPPPPPPPQTHHFAGGMDAMLDGGRGAPSHKRPRHEPHDFSQPVNSYNNASVYAPQPQPLHHVSPYSTTGVYQNNSGSSSFVQDHTPRGTKRRLAASEGGGSKIGQASPRARTKSSRRSSPTKNGQHNPLSSSDPHFSSFVDAATALTGMARAPSDPSQNGSDEDSQGQQHHSVLGGGGTFAQQPHAHVQQNGMSPFAAGSVPPPPRPSTPERAGGAGRQPGAPGGSGGDGTSVEAADLMLFLAQSPSPVQPKKTTNVSLGDGMGMKGRRLFSGVGDADASGGGGDSGDGSAIFGGDLGSAFGPPATSIANASALDAPFDTSSSSSSAFPPPPPTDPTKPSSTSTLSSSLAAPLTAQGQSLDLPPAPATPGRQRQPSLNGEGWANFINASPSPKRTRRASQAAVAAAAGAGGGGADEKGASPSHSVVGEAQAAW